jgi:hypothetical protein
MKKVYLIVTFLISLIGFSQNGISYQALIINPSGEQLPGVNNTNAPLSNKLICLKFSILDSNSNLEYIETHKITTDAYGIVNLIIGTGNQIGGYASSFSNILWNNTAKNLKVDLDVNANCTYFIEISNQPFTYVPFAYYAANTNIKEATTISTGIVQLAGDLGGTGTTATAPIISNNAITSAKIINGAVTPIKIASGANNTVLITDATGNVAWVDRSSFGAIADMTTIEGAGTTANPFKVKDLGIITAKLANGAVTTPKLADAAVTTTKIASGANNTVLVTDATGNVAWIDRASFGAVADMTTIEGAGTTANPFKVKDLGIITAKLANGAVTTPKLADAAVTTIKIASGANNTVLVTDATGNVAWIDRASFGAVADMTTIEGAGTTASPFKVKDLGIVTNKIADLAVTNAKLAADAVTTDKILDGEVQTADIKNLNVTTPKLADAAVTTTKIASGGNNKVLVTDNSGAVAWIDKDAFGVMADQVSIEGAGTTASPFKVKDLGIITAKLANGAVTPIKIASGSNNTVLVTDATGNVAWIDRASFGAVADMTTIEGAGTTASPFKVKDLGIVTSKIADLAVTNAKLAADAVTTDKILDGEVQTADIKNLNVTTPKLADAAVTTTKIASGGNNKVMVTDNTGVVAWLDATAFGAVADMTTIEGAGTTASPFKVKDLGIVTDKIADLAVTNAKLAADAVTTDKILDGEVQAADIKNLNVTTEKLNDAAVTTTKIASGANNTVLVTDATGNVAWLDSASFGAVADMTTIEGAGTTANPFKVKDLGIVTNKLANASVTPNKIAPGVNNTVLVTDFMGNVAWIDSGSFGAVADMTTIEGAGTTASPFKVKDLGIITQKIANNAVTSPKIANAAVTTSKIASGGNNKVLVTDNTGVVAWIDGTAFGAVADMTTIEGAGTTASPFKVKDLGIITSKLADGAVTTFKIADLNVTTAKLADLNVTNAKLADLNVTTNKLANAAVTTTKIASGGNNKVLVTDNTGVVAWLDATAFGAIADMTSIEGAGTSASPFKVKDLGIITSKLADNAVTTNKIADLNITTNKVANNAITSVKLADLNVTTEKINNAAVTTSKIASGGNNKVLVTDNFGVVAWLDATAFGAVADMTTIEGAGTTASPFKVKDLGIVTNKLANLAVTNAKLAADAVTTDKILDGEVQTADIKNLNVTTEKINDAAVTTTKIADANVTTTKLANASVTTTKIASGGNSKVLVTDNTGVVTWIDATDFGAVADMTTIEGAGTTTSPFKVKDLGIITAKLANDAVTSPKILDGTIIVDDLANDAVETAKIKNLNVTTNKLANDAVTTGKILNETILNEDIADNTITTDKIAGQIAVSEGGTGSNMSTTSGYVKQASSGANFTTVTSIPVTDVAGAVIKVNGNLPDSNGNVTVALGMVSTGILANIPLITAPGLVNGDIYVVSGDSNPLNNGLTFIFNDSPAQWLEVTPNQAALDARYLRLAGGTMQGDIVIPATKKITITDTPNTATDAVNKAYVDAQIASGAPDATTSLKGKIQLGGDLAGTGTTAETPIITDNAITTNKINPDAVTTDKIQNGTIISADLADAIITNAKLAETITVPNGGTGATTLTGYVKGNGTSAMTAVATIPVADIVGAQTTANLASDITANTGSTTLYPSVAAVEAFVVNSATPDATTVLKGKIKLAGDLSGTADLPTVPGLALKAPLDSPLLTGVPVSPTAAQGTNTTQIATTEFVTTAVAAATIADATSTIKGKLQLAGDLAGTGSSAASPVITNNAISTNKIATAAVSPIKIQAGSSNSVLVTDALGAVAWLDKGAFGAVADLATIEGVGTTANPFKVKDLGIITAKLDNGAVTTAKLADDAITNAKIGEIISVENGGTGSNMTTTAGYVKQATTGANLSTVSSIPVTDVTGAVRSVNGVVPASNGNVAVIIGRVFTGATVNPDLAASIINASPAKQSSDIYIVADGSNPNNGRTFIYDGTNWLEVATDLSTTDARYVNVAGDTMEGNLTIPTGTKIIITDAPTGSTDAVNKAYVDGLISSSATPDATTSIKGKIKLAGDLSGTADAPTVPDLALKAPLESPSLTGTPLAPTATAGTNTTQIATTAFVTAATAGKQDAITLTTTGTGAASLIGATLNIPTPNNGTVTEVSALTIGTSGTDITSTVATSTTTPVVTLNVPTASAANRGALSAADWTTFNDKIGGSGTTNYVPKFSAAKTLTDSSIFDDGTKVGIGTSSPANTLEIKQGTAGNSGLRFTNLNSSSAASTSASKVLGLNSTGDVILTNIPGTQNIVDFSTATPNSGSPVFTPNTPADESVVYQSAVDNSLWTYNGTTYVTYTAPASTAWNLANTTNDAGSNKTSGIFRTGNVGIGTNNPTAPLEVQSTSVNAYVVAAKFLAPNNTTAGNASQLNFGVSATTGNSADWRYVYQGNGAASNRVDFGMSSYAAPMISYLNSGNVGIGTTAPLTKLVVNDNAYIANLPASSASLMDNTTFRPLTRFQTTSGANNNAISHYLTTTAAATQAHNYSTGASLSYVLQPGGGNVGIGTIAPAIKLHIQGIQTTMGANANSTMLRMSRPTWSGYKWGSAAQFNLGTYDDGVSPGNSKSRLDLVLANVDEALSTTPTMTWLANGNVGINNTAPSAPLVVQGVTGTGALKLIAPSVASGDNWWLGFGHGTTSTDANDRARIGTEIISGGAGRLFFTTGLPGSQTRAMFIDESQRVGIGTSTPTSKLVVRGLNNPVSALGTAQTNAIFRVEGESNHSLDMGTLTASPYGSYVQSHNKGAAISLPLLLNPVGGNVGIGTSNPDYKLSVIGNTRIQPNTTNTGTGGGNLWVEIYGKEPPATDTQAGGIKLGWYNNFGGIEVVRPGSTTGVGLAFNYATTGGTTTEGFRLTNAGRVGIGTTNPGSTLEVNGSATNTAAYNSGSATAILFNNSNLAYTSASPTAFFLQGIKDGGTYTLAVQGTTSGTASFSAVGFTFKSINNGTTIAGKDTLYTFVVMGTTVYVYMAAGF